MWVIAETQIKTGKNNSTHPCKWLNLKSLAMAGTKQGTEQSWLTPLWSLYPSTASAGVSVVSSKAEHKHTNTVVISLRCFTFDSTTRPALNVYCSFVHSGQNWQQPGGPSMDKWMNRSWFAHTVEEDSSNYSSTCSVSQNIEHSTWEVRVKVYSRDQSSSGQCPAMLAPFWFLHGWRLYGCENPCSYTPVVCALLCVC